MSYPSPGLQKIRRKKQLKQEYELNIYLIFDTLKRALQDYADPNLVESFTFELKIIKEYIYSDNNQKSLEEDQEFSKKTTYSKYINSKSLASRMG